MIRFSENAARIVQMLVPITAELMGFEDEIAAELIEAMNHVGEGEINLSDEGAMLYRLTLRNSLNAVEGAIIEIVAVIPEVITDEDDVNIAVRRIGALAMIREHLHSARIVLDEMYEAAKSADDAMSELDDLLDDSAPLPDSAGEPS